MKANEMPKRIYLFDYNDAMVTPLEGDTTYVREDAFIEKAAAWLNEHKEVVETEDNGIMGWIPDYFIDAFKKYMKGEEV